VCLFHDYSITVKPSYALRVLSSPNNTLYYRHNTGDKCVTPFDGDVYLENKMPQLIMLYNILELLFNREVRHEELVGESPGMYPYILQNPCFIVWTLGLFDSYF
jgi:hypothetical protein